MNNKAYPADNGFSGQWVSDANSLRILEDYHRTMLHFFKMQCDQDHTLQSAMRLQEKIIKAALKTTGKTHDYLENPVKRLVLRAVPAQITKKENVEHLSPEQAVLLLERHPEIGQLIKRTLADFKNPVLRIIPGKETKFLGANTYQVNFSSTESIQTLRHMLKETFPGIAAIINLMGLSGSSEGEGLLEPVILDSEKKEHVPFYKLSFTKTDDENLEDAREWFLFLHVFMKELKKSAEKNDAWLINFSFMDGQFGLKKGHNYSLGQAGCVGLTKALAREYPQIKTKCIDLDPSAAPLYIIARLKQEFAAFDGEMEIGLDEMDRWKLDLIAEEPPAHPRKPFQLDSNCVILATGGAYGIVSEILLKIAERYGPRLIILGRSPLPEAESSETASLKTFEALQQFFIKKMKNGTVPVSPGIVLKRVRYILKARQIRQNIDLMEKKAAIVEYHAVDVRDCEKFESLIKNIYKRWGRIDGVIHGAGIIEDKRIETKSLEAFTRVFDTKILPAKVLEKTLRPDHLKFMVFFSSIASRFGNIGQTDYCAANEILNKLADRLEAQWPGRIVSINWGPWDHGMISDDLRKSFATRGIELIAVKQGIKMFFEELFFYDKPASEVVISGNINL